jgi:cysteine-rich repeat protein
VDSRTGSASDCNSTCTHVPVAVAASGDRCCPGAATNLECDASCGDGIRDAGEDCDDGNVVAGDGCAPNCTSESLTQQCAALDPRTVGRGNDACSACICEACAAEAIACYAPREPAEAVACKAVVDCGIEHDCSGTACFCGTAGLLACARGGGNGPCRSAIEAASGSVSVSDVMARSDDAMYPLGRANALGACGKESCAAACGARGE